MASHSEDQIGKGSWKQQPLTLSTGARNQEGGLSGEVSMGAMSPKFSLVSLSIGKGPFTEQVRWIARCGKVGEGEHGFSATLAE